MDVLVSQEVQVEYQEKEVLKKENSDLSPINMHDYDIQLNRIDLLQEKKEVINEELQVPYHEKADNCQVLTILFDELPLFVEDEENELQIVVIPT